MTQPDRMIEINVEFYGLNTFRSALRQVAPDLDKELRTTTRQPVAKVYNRARRLVSSADVPSGWKRRNSGPEGWGDPTRRGWDNAKVRDGIKLRVGTRTLRGVSSLWRITNESPAGAIYEFAKYSQSELSAPFVRKLNRQPTSRLIWRAWDEEGGAAVVTPAVRSAITAVERKFNERAMMVDGGDRIVIS